MAGTKTSGRPSETAQLTTKGGQSVPEMPADLGPHAQKVWQLACEHLPHVLTTLDEPILRLCAEAYQAAMDLRGQPGKESKFIAACGKFDALASRLGLTPHSRRVIKPIAEDQATEETDYDEWFKRGGLN